LLSFFFTFFFYFFVYLALVIGQKEPWWILPSGIGELFFLGFIFYLLGLPIIILSNKNLENTTEEDETEPQEEVHDLYSLDEDLNDSFWNNEDHEEDSNLSPLLLETNNLDSDSIAWFDNDSDYINENFFWLYKDSYFLLEITEDPIMFSETENNDGAWIDEFLDLPSLETDFEFMGNFFFNEIWFEDSDLSPEQWFDSDYFLNELQTIFFESEPYDVWDAANVYDHDSSPKNSAIQQTFEEDTDIDNELYGFAQIEDGFWILKF